MDTKQHAEFREHLERKAKEVAGALRAREVIAVECASDAVDQLKMAVEREMGALALQSGTEVLRQIRVALQRMQTGSYGLCIRCEEEIPLKRLQALPWAVRCVRCQEAEDKIETQKHLSAAA